MDSLLRRGQIQWNTDTTICQGSSKIISLYREIVKSKLPISQYGSKITENIDIGVNLRELNDKEDKGDKADKEA